MEKLLEVTNVCKEFESSNFKLSDVNFSVPQGSIVGLVGENGSGKTTVIQMILGILKVQSGEIRILGEQPDEKKVKENIGAVLDTVQFPETLTPQRIGKVMEEIYEQWDEGLYQSYLTEFQIPQKQKLKTFSQGTLMKLSVITALAHKPQFLVLDEATNALDPIARDKFLELFLDFVGNEKNAILLSSHLTGDLEKIADYIIFLDKGEIILTEKKDTLLYEYGIARCKKKQFAELNLEEMVSYRYKSMQIDVLIKNKNTFAKTHPDIIIDKASIDEILMLLVKGERV